MKYKRFFRIADITFQLESDLEMHERTFSAPLRCFEVKGPGEDTIFVRYHVGLPELDKTRLGKIVGEKRNLTIFKNENGWTYVNTGIDHDANPVQQVTFLDLPHATIDIFLEREEIFRTGNLQLLSFYPNDMLVLTRLLADRFGCMFHSSGAIMNGRGFLFVGHSEAGKSTMVKLIKDHAEILCDDRNIVRRSNNAYRLYGSWNHGEVPTVSANSAPLEAIFFLDKSVRDSISPVENKLVIISRLIACTIKPLASRDWWDRILSVVEGLAQQVPCYSLKFSLTGDITKKLRTFYPGS